MKTFTFTFGLLALTLLFAPDVFAQGFVEVQPLTNLPGLQEASQGGIGPFINNLYKYGVGLGAIMAVLIIMYGGFQYMTSEAVGSKSAGKEDIQRAILGLILLMSPVLVFGVINKDILNLDFNLGRLNPATYAGSTATTTPGGLSYIRYSYIQAEERNGTACLAEERESANRYTDLPSCVRGEGWHRDGGSSSLLSVLTKSCSGETYSPPIPTEAWDRIKDLPACSSITPENIVARKWVGKLTINFTSSETGTSERIFYPATGEPDLEIIPDASKTPEEQEAECLEKTTPEGFMQVFNTSELRSTIGASEILGITEFLHTRSCTDFY